MQGDYVIVRAYREEPLVRRVWDEDKFGVYVVDDEWYERLAVGDPDVSPPLAGFPRKDVFRHDPEVAATIGQWTKETSWDWNRLTLY